MPSMAEKTKVICWGKKRYGFCDVPKNLGEVIHIAAGGGVFDTNCMALVVLA